MRPYEEDLRDILSKIKAAIEAKEQAIEETLPKDDAFWPYQTGALIGTLKSLKCDIEVALKYEPDDDYLILGMQIRELKEENERLREQLADYRRMERGWGGEFNRQIG